MTAPNINLYTEGYLFARLTDWSPLVAAPGSLGAAVSSRSQQYGDACLQAPCGEATLRSILVTTDPKRLCAKGSCPSLPLHLASKGPGPAGAPLEGHAAQQERALAGQRPTGTGPMQVVLAL